MRRTRHHDVTIDDVTARSCRHGGDEDDGDAGGEGDRHEDGLVFLPAVRHHADDWLSQEGEERHDADENTALLGGQPMLLHENQQVGHHTGHGWNNATSNVERGI